MNDMEWNATVADFRSAVAMHGQAVSLAHLRFLQRWEDSMSGRIVDGRELAALAECNMAAAIAGKIRIGWAEAKFQSPIEERMHHILTCSILKSVSICQQHKVKTDSGIKRLDFLLQTNGGRRVAIECDGKEWHDAAKDSVRDMAILRSKLVDRIIRFRGCDIWHRDIDVRWLLCELAPELFHWNKRKHFRMCADTDTGRIAKTEVLHGYTIITVDRCVGLDDDARRPFSPGCQVMFMDPKPRYEKASTQYGSHSSNATLSRGGTSRLLVSASGDEPEGCEVDNDEDEVE